MSPISASVDSLIRADGEFELDGLADRHNSGCRMLEILSWLKDLKTGRFWGPQGPSPSVETHSRPKQMIIAKIPAPRANTTNLTKYSCHINLPPDAYSLPSFIAINFINESLNSPIGEINSVIRI